MTIPQSMNLPVLLQLTLIATYECMPDPSIKYNDVATAMDHLYELTPNQTSSDKRCIRYAVMSSFLSSRGRPHTKAMSHFGNLSDEDLYSFYHNLESEGRLPGLYMSAIDGYRSAFRIGPAFLELIECLRRIEGPNIDTYLNNPELVQIVHLSRQVLQSPDAKIDLEPIRKKRFTTAFLKYLVFTFKDNLQDNSIADQEHSNQASSSNQNQERNPWGWFDPRQKFLRQNRHREQERLRNHRLKVLEPVTPQQKRRSRVQHQLKEQRAQQRRETLRQAEEWYLSYRARLGQSVHVEAGTSSRQQQEPDIRKSSFSAVSQQSPDLLHLWAGAAPIYESTPTISEQNQPESLSVHHEESSQPVEATLTDSETTPPLVHQAKRTPDQVIPAWPDPQMPLNPQAPSATSMELFPRFPQPIDFQEATTFAVLRDLGAEDRYRAHDHLIGGGTQSQSISALPTLDQFEDIESALASFPDRDDIDWGRSSTLKEAPHD